jgi:hypothetical protein
MSVACFVDDNTSPHPRARSHEWVRPTTSALAIFFLGSPIGICWDTVCDCTTNPE